MAVTKYSTAAAMLIALLGMYRSGLHLKVSTFAL